MPKVIQAIETWESKGKGTEESPFRRVRTLWSLDGDFLGEDDPLKCGGKLILEPLFSDEVERVKNGANND